MDMAPRLVAAGLGLDHGTVRLARATEEWIAVGSQLRSRIVEVLGDAAADVQAVGSAAVPGLSAKPIVDLAVGLGPGRATAPVIARLTGDGWLYRGDAGADGGHVFVLEARPAHRVAHLHAVPHGGEQWCDYLRLRDLLRASPRARARYEAAKRDLARRHPADRRAYTEGKTGIVTALLRHVG